MATANGWLRVTVKANDRTGLVRPHVFSFGNLIGESGDAGATPGWRVNAVDVAAVKRVLSLTTVPVTRAADVNRDGRVNALDVATVKGHLTRALPLPSAAAWPTADVSHSLVAERRDRETEDVPPLVFH